MAELLGIAPSSFFVDFGLGADLVFKSVKVPGNNPKTAGAQEPLGAGRNGMSFRQINSSGFAEVVKFEVVSILSPSPASASVVMQKWFKDCLPPSEGGNGKWKSSKKDGSIFAYDTDDNLIAQWDFFEAWPSMYKVGEFSVSSDKYVEETWTIVSEKCDRVL
jgi:hypothetical protein